MNSLATMGILWFVASKPEGTWGRCDLDPNFSVVGLNASGFKKLERFQINHWAQVS